MKYLLNKIKFTKAEKIFLFSLICLFLGFWVVSGRIWLRVNQHNVSIDGMSLSEGSDYFVFRSLNGDIFCYHQDHGTQYLILPKRSEISIISEGEDVIILPDFILFSHHALASLEDSNTKKRLANPNLVVKNGFIEFVGIHNERWRVPY